MSFSGGAIKSRVLAEAEVTMPSIGKNLVHKHFVNALVNAPIGTINANFPKVLGHYCEIKRDFM